MNAVMPAPKRRPTPLVEPVESGLAVYVHWPWCKKKCPYCDFNSHVTPHIPEDDYISAIVREIQTAAFTISKRTLTSVFFGGGTPSLMQPASVSRILQALHTCFGLTDETEITLEANPTSAEAQKFKDYVIAGVNRFSIGVQGLDGDMLHFLGRQHSTNEALLAVNMALEATPNVNLDLIFGTPDQHPDVWARQLAAVAQLGTSHISCYQLTLEKNTVFWKLHNQGELILPDDDAQADMYVITEDILAQHGFGAYEISNYAQIDHECRHNRHVWRYGDYLGVGAGAHGRIRLNVAGPVATRNLKMPDAYMQAITQKGDARFEETPLNAQTQVQEALMMGLRLTEGVPLARLEHFGHKPWPDLLDLKGLNLMRQTGFVVLDNDWLRATDLGRPLLDSVLTHLLPQEL